MIEDHLSLLVLEGVTAQDVVVALDPLLVELGVGRQVTVDHTHGHAVHLPPHTHHPLVPLNITLRGQTEAGPYSPSNLQTPAECTGSPGPGCGGCV